MPEPWAWGPDVGLRTLTPVGGLLQYNYPSWVADLKGMGFYYTVSPFFLPLLLWFLLYVFSCRRSFLVGPTLSHQ